MRNPIMRLRSTNKYTADARNAVHKSVLLCAVCLLMAAVPVAAELDAPIKNPEPQSPDFVPGELLVKFRSEVRQEATATYAYWFDISTRRTFAINGYQLVQLPDGVNIEEALELYLEDSDVEHAEPNYIVSADLEPTDPGYDKLWGLNNTGQFVYDRSGTVDADIDAPGAWDVITEANDVVVAVIDSGVDVNHEDLKLNMWVNPGEVPDNGDDDDGNGYVDDVNGWDHRHLDT